MKKYNVHAFVVVRVKYEGSEAETQEAAIEKCMAQHLHELYDPFKSENLREPPPGSTAVEFGEEVSHFLVDIQGDEGFENSTWHNSDGAKADQINPNFSALESP